MNYKQITNTESFEVFKTLLRMSKLPADDLDFYRDFLIGQYEEGELIATGALEMYGDSMLLRSIVVKLEFRSRSLGSHVTSYLLDYARQQNTKSVYLLTETAKDFFQRKGFEIINRDAVSDEVKTSSEFANVCPASAVAMRLMLTQ